MSRFKAFAIHLGISMVIFVVLAAIVLYLWYPGFFFETDGGWQGIQIIVLVDLVLGPLLTLVVYKAGKPGLKMDLTLIGIFQSLCLIAGTYVVYNERPLALIYADGQFNSVTADSYRNAQLPLPDFSAFPGAAPKWITVALPEDPVAQSRARKVAIDNQMPTALLTDFYQPFRADHPLVLDDAADYGEVKARDYQGAGTRAFFAQHGGSPSDYRFYPYAARYQYFYLAFTRTDNTLVDSIATRSQELLIEPD